jgi:cation diffusion facilitator CzcD-associated flavoprotein CzcO
LADWLESYAKNMELNIWTSSTVTSATPDDSKKWIVKVTRGDGRERTFKVNHVVFATGFGGGAINFPTFPGQESFGGQILHSSTHKKATGYVGKKVVIIGACTSAHDIAVDFYEHGIDVTMIQRSSTYVIKSTTLQKIQLDALYSETSLPTDIADKILASIPNLMQFGLLERAAAAAAAANADR